jgi:hypothetical protein
VPCRARGSFGVACGTAYDREKIFQGAHHHAFVLGVLPALHCVVCKLPAHRRRPSLIVVSYFARARRMAMVTIEKLEACAVDYLRLFVVALQLELDRRPTEAPTQQNEYVLRAELETERILLFQRENLPAEYRARRLIDTAYVLGVWIFACDMQDHEFAPTSDQLDGLRTRSSALAGPLLRGEIH